ncbi:5'-methylthioadenosine/adenosylhomocysteine nucleosidase [Snodgrassella sp. ESL0253]|uniref:5'-methylthioadenosine/adenosylhomocysteine nucleosidase n=1 Tax=Snodgrassella sp. ESL0253 TaxID=2705031 RepID=UPI0015818CA2|nr:5'-methylthioadenosine/adenosylhomocysteine nucleosidase [Snodgrassella sp. ESL0253]NUE66767.1 5'-methylthioadenosine/adenosylhomocysteine nucleosidase [Snodgrassella sp. ESL0253]
MDKPLIAIIAAMQPELDYLLEQLDNRQDSVAGAVHFHQGEIKGVRVILALSGIGKVNAALTTSVIIERFAPDYVINTGSAGGLKAGIQIGDVVVGNEVAHHDVDVTVFGYVPGQVPQLPPRFFADQHLIDAAKQAAQVFTGAEIHTGLIVSGDQFIGTAEQNRFIKENFADVVAVEMEAAAIAQTCHQLNVPFVIIRAISDNGDANASISFEQFLQQAAIHSAKMIINLISIHKP